MFIQEGIDQNTRFLIVEVRKQLEQTRDYLETRSPDLLASVRARDDYIDNLKSVVQRKCFTLAAEALSPGAVTLDRLKAINVISANLERIADFCENVIKQLGYVQNESLLRARHFGEFFEEIIATFDLIDKSLFGQDVQVALQICRAEHRLDRLYGQAFSEVLEELRTGHDTETLVTVLFISHYFERMGDSLLNIGEAVISACLGERIKIDQFHALEDSLAERHLDRGVTLHSVGETRSGCRINRVTTQGEEASRSLIFKEGRLAKINDEKLSIERWKEIMPGLAPRVFSFQDQGETGALLVEYLSGRTFDEILLRGDDAELDAALTSLCRTLETIWNATRVDEPVSSHFLSQLRGRLEDVYTVHPEFRGTTGGIGQVRLESFEDLIERAERVEERLLAPFSVFIHGDLNVDNIIYDADTRELHFIDLHRSRMMDYVQDVSVFLVSNHRLPAFDARVRRRIDSVTFRFYDFAAGYAKSVGDRSFDARLAFGLARSFATSARFVLDRGVAKAMFLRARYFLERLLAVGDPVTATFELPREALVD